jgi:hypothetical protein
MAKMLVDKGIVVGLENSGSMERMNTRNLPFLAGTCAAAYGLDKDKHCNYHFKYSKIIKY